ncbi:unnamed protein product [Schistosoma margrebowiei]|uniref:Uncharacterized protein n=1 Tax=Schistosoma margrebowiei TaxID=48269 RepID=A0A183LRR9_9TREM|nr:unnamed protein product [Schistosoma margrebowiei]
MKTSTSEGNHRIQWTAWMQLDDLNFIDDLALLSHTHQQIQMKATRVAAVSASIGLNIQEGKSNTLKYNIENTNQITLDGEALEQVESFMYLCIIIDEKGGPDSDVKARVDKARAAFLQLKNIWNSKQPSTNIKLLCGRSLPKWINRLATIGSKLPFIERTLPIEWLKPHQQINNHINKIEQYDNNIECIEQSNHLNIQTTSLPNIRRISTIERLQNCVHRFHKGNIHKHEQNHHHPHHSHHLINSIKSDTYSLIDIPLNNKTQIDYDLYLYLTQFKTFYKSNSNNEYNKKINSSVTMTTNTWNMNTTNHCIINNQFSNNLLTNRIISSYGISLPSLSLNHFDYSHQSIKRSQSIEFDNIYQK